MKKARIMLSAIAVLAVIGGAFAFKANNRGLGRVYWPTVPNGLAVSTVNYVPFTIPGATTTTKPCALTTKYATTTTTTAGLVGTVYATVQ